MTIELDKKGLIALVKGTSPNTRKNDIILNTVVSYSDQYGRYTWNDGLLNRYTEEGLYELYLRATDSWD